ncbi:tRNA (cytosine-5-)-methyltransferase ncl1 [Dispira simplex]|nr:tRNA (cytosine-5-)-methyltransferase ncl1 [Dispira simplex]
MAGHGRRWIKKRKNDKPKERGTWNKDFKPITELEKSNEIFEKYYKAQNLLNGEAEWGQFMATLRVMLPTAFRIMGNRTHAAALRAQLEQDFIPFIQSVTVDGEKVEPPAPISWYPDQLGWQFTVPRVALKKSETLKKFHQFLVNETEVGNICRQEAVSMIPPLLLDVQPGHRVVDMCAAPGSKTSQILEAIHANVQADQVAQGLVIANDANLRRACMLVHQTKRLHSPCLLVTHQEAEQFSNVLYPGIISEGNPSQEVLRFDRILCDVPCSGDGTIRKNLLIWRDWKIADALGLHRLQLKIAKRAAYFLKVNGRMVYSTCSLNPVENEAVVAELIRECEGAIQLVDVSDQLPGLIRRPGLSTWKVMRKDGQFADAFDDFLDEGVSRSHDKYPPSVFPPDNAHELHLERCLRIYPHFQNTGGFFVAVLEKIRPLSHSDESRLNQPDTVGATTSVEGCQGESPAVKPTTNTPSTTDSASADTTKDSKPLKEEPYIFVDQTDEDLDSIWKFFDLSAVFPRDQFLVRSEESKQRTLYMVSADIKAVMSIPKNERLRIVNTGIRCFSRNDVEGTSCTYRIHSEALPLVYPFMGEKRKVQLSTADLKLLLNDVGHVNFTKLSEDLQSKVIPMELGCVVGVMPTPSHRRGSEEVRNELSNPLLFPLWRGKGSLNLLLSKQDKRSLHYRVFGKELKVKTYPTNTSREENAAASAE